MKNGKSASYWVGVIHHRNHRNLRSHHVSRSNPTKERLKMLQNDPFAATMAARYIEDGLWWAANMHKAWHALISLQAAWCCAWWTGRQICLKAKSEYERKGNWQIYLWIDICYCANTDILSLLVPYPRTTSFWQWTVDSGGIIISDLETVKIWDWERRRQMAATI